MEKSQFSFHFWILKNLDFSATAVANTPRANMSSEPVFGRMQDPEPVPLGKGHGVVTTALGEAVLVENFTDRNCTVTFEDAGTRGDYLVPPRYPMKIRGELVAIDGVGCQCKEQMSGYPAGLRVTGMGGVLCFKRMDARAYCIRLRMPADDAERLHLRPADSPGQEGLVHVVVLLDDDRNWSFRPEWVERVTMDDGNLDDCGDCSDCGDCGNVCLMM